MAIKTSQNDKDRTRNQAYIEFNFPWEVCMAQVEFPSQKLSHGCCLACDGGEIEILHHLYFARALRAILVPSYSMVLGAKSTLPGGAKRSGAEQSGNCKED